MSYWKVPVRKVEYSFVIIESECIPDDQTIEDACEELQIYDWTDTGYDLDEEPYEVSESYACDYNIFKG